jgi:hypothetical protein
MKLKFNKGVHTMTPMPDTARPRGPTELILLEQFHFWSKTNNISQKNNSENCEKY